MRLAYVCADFGVPLDGSKGASVHVREMVRALSALGHEVVLLSPALDPGAAGPAGTSLAAATPPEGIEAACFRIGLDPAHAALLEQLRQVEDLVGRETRLRQELRNLLYNVSLLERGREILRRHPVDAVYERYTLFVGAGLRLARDLGVPHLLEVNAPLADEQERTRGLELRTLARDAERRLLSGSDAVLVVSEPLVAFARECGTPAARVHLVPNGVDPERFDPGRARPALPAGLSARLAGKWVVGFVGTLKPWHGLETLLEAFRTLHARVPAAHLLVVGDGPGRGALERETRAHRLEDAVTLAGAVPHDLVPACLAAMDVSTAPGNDDPGFYFSPIKIFESMAMGTPVVAGAVAGLPRLLADGETAVLVEPGRADGLAAALERLARDPALCRRIGGAARAWVLRERTWESNARRVVSIAATLRSERPAGAAEVRG